MKWIYINKTEWFLIVKNDLFFVFVFYVLCEKYYIDVLKYYIANCVSWVPRLTLLDLQIDWTTNALSEQNV